MASVIFKNISKRFDSVVAVDNLNLEVQDGEFLVLLGPSGCGKTTTMRIVAGLETESEGDILIGDNSVKGLLPKYRDIAMVFQSYALYPHMTVYQNIEYPLRIRKRPISERRQSVLTAAKRVHLEAELERFPRQLSGGQQQRVALARSLIRNPQLFLMDEPLSNLDAKLRVKMRAEIKHLQHELGITTIYVTHDQIEAMTLADRIAVMNEGVVQQLAEPKDIYNNPANLFVAGFIGSPTMNLIRGDLKEGNFSSNKVLIEKIGGGSHGSVVLGVRPEDTEIVSGEGGHFSAPIYSVELTGEVTLVNVSLDDENIFSIRADKDFVGEIDKEVNIRINLEKIFLFDSTTEQRIRI